MSEQRDAAADMSLCDAATAGPWECDDDGRIETADGTTVATIQEHGNINTVSRTGEYFSHADGRFVATARDALPWWIGEAERLRGENERLRMRIRGLESALEFYKEDDDE